MITSLDSNQLRNPYDFNVVSIHTEGPLTLLGPTQQVLHGGALSVYVGSKQKRGKGRVNVHINNQTYTFDITVE